jgi:hypothetical protein
MLFRLGWVSSLSLSPYGERFRAMRRHIAGTLGVKPAKQFEGLQELKILTLCQRLLDSPERFREHIRQWVWIVVSPEGSFESFISYVRAVILKISHGYDVSPENESLVTLADKSAEEFSEAARAGAFLVDILPWCLSLVAS